MQENNTVFVLGAGFTKAFYEDAPLLIDFYNIDIKKFNSFSIYNIIENELEKEKSMHDNKIDIERLLTRLYGLPYDDELEESELYLIFSEIEKIYKNRIIESKRNIDRKKEDLLQKFATYCIDKEYDCITFNHDDFFDDKLYRHGWLPDLGYGFFLQPTLRNIKTRMVLLKLHGSVNWRIKKGYKEVHCRPDDIIHYERWLADTEFEKIDDQLEKDSLIMPPILDKSGVLYHPTIRGIWQQAAQKLNNSDNVIFIGYSLPKTDILANFLFSDNILHNNITVVDYKKEDESEGKDKLKRSYKEVFPKIKENQFYWEGAINWFKHRFSEEE